MRLINPLKEFGLELNSVQSPSRYIGGEFGSIKKEHTPNDDLLNFVIAFPDLYEIGMSNSAIKIIYNGLNKNPHIRAERVFSPDLDFTSLLEKKNIPLYSLETGMSLKDVDVLAFSIGYELGATEVLAILNAAGIPLLKKDRKEEDPLVIAGGCGVTNPCPFSDFFEGIMIGEAEDALFDMCEDLYQLKKKNASRAEKIDFIQSKTFIWSDGHKARRTVQADFGIKKAVPQWFPVANLKPVQDHGVVEIMRGCPNGCRFCHAGIYYRPSRTKKIENIVEEIDHLVFDAGYKEISLNSLSSADFPEIEKLLDFLNERYRGYNISFQLPSLKVNSLSLPILEKLSKVRRSGLTFAVETPEEQWQLSLNKEVYAQHLEKIIKEAKNKGWSSAKFYFMIGLPLGDYFGEEYSDKKEEVEIVNFLQELQKKTHIQMNVNVGVFIPKAHTPYQWVKQISIEKAQKKIAYIKENLPFGKFKVGKHNFNTTLLEGLFSRGDSRVGDLILKAFKKGVRFDAWDEHLQDNMKIWNEVFEEASWNVKDYVYKDWSLEEELPWDSVSLGTSKEFFKREWEKSKKSLLTERCESECSHKCGICNKKDNIKAYRNNNIDEALLLLEKHKISHPEEHADCNIPVLYRVIFNFTRKDGGEFIAYLSQLEMFYKAFFRTNLPVVFTSGFNPIPRLEFATAMTMGIPSLEETASCLMYDDINKDDFIRQMNKALPEYLRITEAYIFPCTTMRKRESLSSSFWGCCYEYEFKDIHFLEILKENSSFKDFFLSETQNKWKIIYSDSKKKIISVQTKGSDKKLRELMESILNCKWYECCKIVKTKTLSFPDVQGWTLKDEENWRNSGGKTLKKTEEKIVSSDKEPVSYFELYKKIASVNAELIAERKRLDEKRDRFYAEHPEVKERHLKNKMMKKN